MDTLTPPERSERMGRVRSKDTKPELAVRRLVHSLDSPKPADKPGKIEDGLDKYTIIGFWPDTHQRFCDWVCARNPEEAESICLTRYAGLVICAVLLGEHQPIESAQPSE